MAEPTIINGRYEILGPIGAGGMGTLYRARDPRIGNRLVAIKLLKDGLDNEELRRRFKQEGDAAGVLQHENIVRVIDVGEHNGAPFIAMEYIDGETLATLIRRSEPLSLIRRLQIMEELCDGLAFAHSFGIVHRDVKPANLMLERRRGRLGRLKILDFGIAKVAEAGLTNAGALIGTFNYMSPEQMRGTSIDHRSDIFSVGAVCYELLCYKQAFPGTLQDGIMGRILEQPPVPLRQLNPAFDPEVERIVTRALEKDRDQRYPDLSAMLEEIRERREELERAAGADETVVTDDDGARQAAAPTPTPRPATPTPKPPTPTPANRGLDRDRLEQIRKRQIAEQLDSARVAFAAGQLEQAVEACERASAIDPANAEAVELHDLVLRAIEERDFNQLIGDATIHMAKGELTTADQILDQAQAMNLDATRLEDLRRQVADARQRQSAERVIARGRERLAAGDLDGAERAASEAAGLAPTGMGELASFRAAVQTKRDEQARRRRQIDEATRAAAAALDAGDVDAAAGEIARAREAGGDVAGLDERLTALREAGRVERERIDEERRRKQELERRVERALSDAKRLFDRGARQEAIGTLEAFVPADDARIRNLLARLRTDAKRLAEQERAEAERRKEEARVRAEHERAERMAREAAETVERARRLLKSGARKEALAALREAPNASHPIVAAGLQEFGEEVARLDEQDRLEARERAQDEERQRQAALEAAADTAIERAHRQFVRGQRDRAIATLSVPEVAGHPRVARYLDEIRQAPAPAPPSAPWWRSRVGLGAAGLFAAGLVGTLVFLGRPAPGPGPQPTEMKKPQGAAIEKPAARRGTAEPGPGSTTTNAYAAALDAWTRGQRDDALRQVGDALKTVPTDASLQTLQRQMVDAQRALNDATAARAAVVVDGGSRMVAPFAQAEDLLASAGTEAPGDALPKLQRAEQLFKSARVSLVGARAKALTSVRAYRSGSAMGTAEERRERRQTALNDVAAAMKVLPRDKAVSEALGQMVQVAGADAGAARSAAQKQGATSQMPRYRDAEDQLAFAQKLDQLSAVPALWNAADEFNAAAREAGDKTKATAPASSPLATAVSSPSPGTNAGKDTVNVPPRTPVKKDPLPAPPSPEEAAVRQTLRSYEQAYSAMDLRAVSKIWPAEHDNAKRTFDMLKSVRLSIANERVQINGNVATVLCQVSYQYDWKRSGPPPSSSTSTTLILGRDGGGWTILRGFASDR